MAGVSFLIDTCRILILNTHRKVCWIDCILLANFHSSASYSKVNRHWHVARFATRLPLLRILSIVVNLIFIANYIWSEICYNEERQLHQTTTPGLWIDFNLTIMKAKTRLKTPQIMNILKAIIIQFKSIQIKVPRNTFFFKD